VVVALAAALSVAIGDLSVQPTVPTPSPPVVQTAPSAQTAPSGQAPASAQAVATSVTLPSDTLVRIELAEAVDSKNRKRGDTFAIRLAHQIIIDGKILAEAGAVGGGEVVYAERGGGGGSPGKLVLAARYLNIGAVRVRLKAFNLAAGGESDFRELQVASELIGPAVLFINGHNVLYPEGTRARAKVAEDVVLPILGTAPPPSDASPPSSSTSGAASAPTMTAPAPTPASPQEPPK
jgi:hypothetical protein